LAEQFATGEGCTNVEQIIATLPKNKRLEHGQELSGANLARLEDLLGNSIQHVA